MRRILACLCAGGLVLCEGAFAFGSGDDRGSVGFRGLLLIPSARLAALGNAAVALPGNATPFTSNPASVATLRRRTASFSVASYVLDIAPVGGVVVLPAGNGVWSFSAGGLSYGQFERVDALAAAQGTFSAGDMIVHLGWARAWKYGLAGGFSVGWIRSRIAEFSASALVANVGLLWELNHGRTFVGLSANNMGGALSSFLGGEEGMKDQVPTAFHVGVLHRPAHFPLPLALLADVTLPRDDEAFLSLGAELQVAAPLTLRAGYHALVRYLSADGPDGTRQRGLSFDDRRTAGFGGLGLRCGVGLVWKGFGVDYAYAPVGPFGGTHHLTARVQW